MRALAAVLFALVLSACTSVGTTRHSVVTAGGEQELRLCIWLGKDLPESVAADMVEAWNLEEGGRFGLRASYRIEGRFDVDAVSPYWFIKAHPYIPEGCDRNVALNGRQIHRAVFEAASILFGSPVFMKLGGAIGSHAVIAAEYESIGHLAISPKKAFRHEVTHMLGCVHGTEAECLTAISDVKSARVGEFLPVLYPITKKQQKLYGRNIETDRYRYNLLIYHALTDTTLESGQ